MFIRTLMLEDKKRDYLIFNKTEGFYLFSLFNVASKYRQLCSALFQIVGARIVLRL